MIYLTSGGQEPTAANRENEKNSSESNVLNATALTGRIIANGPLSIIKMEWDLKTADNVAEILKTHLIELQNDQIQEPDIIAFLFKEITTQFDPKSEEAIQLLLYACKKLKNNQVYLNLLFSYSPEKFIEHAADFQIEPALVIDYAKKLLQNKGPESALTFILARRINLKGTSLDFLIPFIKDMAPPFSWPLFTDHLMTLDLNEKTRMNIFNVISTFINIEKAAPLFSKLKIRNPQDIQSFAQKLFENAPEIFKEIFKDKELLIYLAPFAKNWINKNRFSGDYFLNNFPFELLHNPTDRNDLALQLANFSTVETLENLSLFKFENEKALFDVVNILVDQNAEHVAVNIDNLGLKNRENINLLVNILVKKLDISNPDSEENMTIFLTNIATARLGDRKNWLMQQIFAVTPHQLNFLFGNLPLTKENKKCISCFIPCILNRFICYNGQNGFNLQWEDAAKRNSRFFKDSNNLRSCIQLLDNIRENRWKYCDEDLNTILNQIFHISKEEELKTSDRLNLIKNRINLLKSLLDLDALETFSKSLISLEDLEEIFNARSTELLGFSVEEQTAILARYPDGTTFKKLIKDKFLSWRSPHTIFLFLLKIDTMDPEEKEPARKAAKEFLTAYLSCEYETWRYEHSPHLKAMRQIGAMNENLQKWWQANPAPVLLDLNTTIELSSNPNDFMLSGEECGGCQRLNNPPEFVLPLLGLTDGVVKAIVVRNKETGKMVTRAYIRWLTDKTTKKPVLLLEKAYSFQDNSDHKEAILKYAQNYVLGTKNYLDGATEDVALVTSFYFRPVYNITTPTHKYPHQLHAEGCFSPLIYSDAYGFSESGGKGGFATNGHYIIKNTIQIN
jgi:hypothetical protein